MNSGFLGIATNVLGQRLNQLVSARVVRKEPYQNNPVRYRYLLSERGEDLYGFIGGGLAMGQVLDTAGRSRQRIASQLR